MGNWEAPLHTYIILSSHGGLGGGKNLLYDEVLGNYLEHFRVRFG